MTISILWMRNLKAAEVIWLMGPSSVSSEEVLGYFDYIPSVKARINAGGHSWTRVIAGEVERVNDLFRNLS